MNCILMAATDLPGWDGFLGTRASLMMDAVVVAMAAVLPCMFWSIQQVRRGRYVLHRRVQLALAVALLAAVTAFEVDVRVHGWRERATEGGGSPSTLVWTALGVHLVFAVSTAVLWPIVVVRAMRRFPSPPAPGEHSASHRRWARLAAWDMTATAVTGWIFYWLAFVQ
ncbi:DUF420 domain-containing protein [Pirellulales bacterium]|nr:DUF420 domain-containing protein [Pirellulales bacterium]